MTSFEEQLSDQKYRHGREFPRTSKRFTLALVPPAPPPLKILDVGCGTGLNAEHLASLGHQVWGVDISAVAISHFRELGFPGEQADIGQQGFPFPAASFDLVFASEVLEHLVDTPLFLSETLRVLVPGGRLVLSTPNSAFWVYRVGAVFGQSLGDIQHPGHVRFFSRKGLLASTAQAGFESIQLAGRHLYFLVSGPWFQKMAPFLEQIGFIREHRFRTHTDFWQISRFSPRASGFWADTFILSATKPIL